MLAALIAAVASSGPVQDAEPRPAPQGARVELTKTFHTRSPWRLDVTEGPATEDYAGNNAPGPLTLCLRRGPAGPCISDVVDPTRKAAASGDPAWEPHYLFTAKAVYPHGSNAEPFLLIVTGSLNSGDGDQIVATQLLTYERGRDAFRRVFAKSVGRNNNEEVRFVTEGPLRGSVITAEPQTRRPYGYWIEIDSPTNAGAYLQRLRYGSATRYNDGNPLTVIDSEMPDIERQLGLWKPGEPIPLPPSRAGDHPCRKPTLQGAELWCR